jgi:hypothetical protein
MLDRQKRIEQLLVSDVNGESYIVLNQMIFGPENKASQANLTALHQIVRNNEQDNIGQLQLHPQNMAMPQQILAFGDQQGAMLAAPFKSLLEAVQWISPIRRSEATMVVSGAIDLAADAQNLADVFHRLRSNHPEQFEEVQNELRALVPNVRRLLAPVERNTTTVATEERCGTVTVRNRLDQLSSGIRTALAIITKLVLTPPGQWVCVEEPEAHLHPAAQEVLFRFLHRQAESKRILLSTHSAVMAGMTSFESLHLVRRNEDNATVASVVRPEDIATVIEELGIRPSYNFEADAVVFVEGDNDPDVYATWAERLSLGRRVQFIGAEGWTTMDYFANAKILESRHVQTPVFLIFDGDTERDAKRQQQKQSLMQRLRIDAGRVLTLQQNELEGHLLNTRAILKAFPTITIDEAALEARLAPYRTRRNQKIVLDELMREQDLGRYDGRAGARIAQCMENVPQEVEQFLQAVMVSIR